jgi:hypothetical protein
MTKRQQLSVHNVENFRKADAAVQVARKAAADDPECKYLFGVGNQDTFGVFPGGSYQYWQEPYHTATATFLDTGEALQLEATSADELRQKLVRLRDQLLASYRKAQIEMAAPTTRWKAIIDYADGRQETAVAESRDELLMTLLVWKGETAPEPQGGRPQRSHDALWNKSKSVEWNLQKVEEMVAVRQFLEAVGDQFYQTSKNVFLLVREMRLANKPFTVAALIEKFDELYDAETILDQPGTELNEEEQRRCQQVLDNWDAADWAKEK